MLLARPGLRIWIADEFGKVCHDISCSLMIVDLLGPQYHGFQGSSVFTAFTSSASALSVYFTCYFLSLLAIFHSTLNAKW